jgi:hypothetical protein
MVLLWSSDEKLMELIHSGYIPSDVHLGPCSVDLTLAEDYLVPHLPEDRPYSRSQKTTRTNWHPLRVLCSTQVSLCWQARMN